MKRNFEISAIALTLLLISCASSFAQWKRLPSFTDRPISCLAATRTKIFAGSDNGHIFSSNDTGKTWTLSLPGLNGEIVRSIATTGDTIAACTEDAIYISKENGENWFPISPWRGGLLCLAFCGTELYIGMYDKILRSKDLGANWDTIRTGAAGFETNAFAFSHSTLVAGNLLSIDSGKSWTQYGVDIGFDLIVYSLLYKGSDIYAGTAEGICISHNDGRNWFNENGGFYGLPEAMSFISFVSDDSNIYVANDKAGVFLSTNNGASWSHKNNDSTPNWNVNTLLIKDGNLFAGTPSGGWLMDLSAAPDTNSITGRKDTTLWVSPTPATGILTIHNVPNNLAGISIVNLLGGKIMEIMNPPVGDLTINLSNLLPGIYYAIFKVENSVEIRKILKE